MFSGIHSLIFGKKHKHKGGEESSDERAQSLDNEFVVIERRHSGDFDKNSGGLYPDLDPSKPVSSNLPYVVSPSLPNLNEATSDESVKKDDVKVDMLQAVPFVLSPEILLLSDDSNRRLESIMDSLNELKDSGDEGMLESFSYDFELEHSVSVDYS